MLLSAAHSVSVASCPGVDTTNTPTFVATETVAAISRPPTPEDVLSTLLATRRHALLPMPVTERLGLLESYAAASPLLTRDAPASVAETTTGVADPTVVCPNGEVVHRVAHLYGVSFQSELFPN